MYYIIRKQSSGAAERETYTIRRGLVKLIDKRRRGKVYGELFSCALLLACLYVEKARKSLAIRGPRQQTVIIRRLYGRGRPLHDASRYRDNNCNHVIL